MIKMNTNFYVVAIFVVVFCVSAMSHASFMLVGTLYKSVNKDGTVTYSDQPSPGAIEVVIDVPTNTIKSNVTIPSPQAIVHTKQKVKYQVSILNPEPEATIRSNTGEISIGAAIEPKLIGFYQLHINGEIHESATGMFKLDDMARGEYQYTVKFIDNSGKVIASTELRKLYLHQASSIKN